MLNTSRRAIPYPNTDRSDRPDIPLHFQNLANALDVDVVYDQGTDAARIADAHQAGGGRLWWTTDTLIMWYDDGTNWHQVGVDQTVVIGNAFRAGTHAARPAAGTVDPGTAYYETDTLATFRSNGITWQPITVPEATVTADTNRTGTFAARPAAGTVNPGTIYFATDLLLAYRSDGATWTQMTFRDAQMIDYAERSTSVAIAASVSTEGGAVSVLSSNSVTYDGGPIEIVFHSPGAERTSVTGGSGDNQGELVLVALRDATVLGSEDHGTQITPGRGPAIHTVFLDTPPAGAHVYTIKAYSQDALAHKINAGAGGAGNLSKTWIKTKRA